MLQSRQERPIALVVEDQPSTLARRRQLFSEHGFQAIGAQSVSEALREFRGTPTIDIVVTDINLETGKESDRSGVTLALALRSRRPGLPVIALSGYFDSLDELEKKPFSDVFLKGSYNVRTLEQRLTGWRKRALEYRRTRAEKARSELARLRDEGNVAEPDIEVLRDFLPGAHAARRVATCDTPDDVLRREGWRLRLVEAGFPLADGTVKTNAAVPFWIRQERSVTIAVLHGHSCIYQDGKGDEEAVRDALELMFGYAQEFERDRSTPLTQELEELRAYVQKVFG